LIEIIDERQRVIEIAHQSDAAARGEASRQCPAMHPHCPLLAHIGVASTLACGIGAATIMAAQHDWTSARARDPLQSVRDSPSHRKGPRADQRR